MAISESNSMQESADESELSGRYESNIETNDWGSAVCITLDGDDLRGMGINPDKVDSIKYRIYNGVIIVNASDS